MSSLFSINERKQKDRLAAVSPKRDNVLIGFNQNGPLQLDAITGRYCSACQ